MFQSSSSFLYPEMLPVQGGTFFMGSDEREREQPIHEVTLREFYLSKYPITNREYAQFLNAYGSDQIKAGRNKGQKMIYKHDWGMQKINGKWQPSKGYEDRPVIYVTWYGASAYCGWLLKETGEAYRLPSAAAWEYAARGGNRSGNYIYSGSPHIITYLSCEFAVVMKKKKKLMEI